MKMSWPKCKAAMIATAKTRIVCGLPFCPDPSGSGAGRAGGIMDFRKPRVGKLASNHFALRTTCKAARLFLLSSLGQAAPEDKGARRDLFQQGSGWLESRRTPTTTLRMPVRIHRP